METSHHLTIGGIVSEMDNDISKALEKIRTLHTGYSDPKTKWVTISLATLSEEELKEILTSDMGVSFETPKNWWQKLNGREPKTLVLQRNTVLYRPTSDTQTPTKRLAFF